MANSAPSIERIFSITNELQFNQLAIEIFHFQYSHNKVYRQFCDLVHIDPIAITYYDQIPFLPVEFFKTHIITTGEKPSAIVFSSSGTTGDQTSRHHIVDLRLYNESFKRGFELFYKSPQELCILALLPSYLERSGSSLVYMAEKLIAESGHPESGFYLHNTAELSQKLRELSASGQKTILLGVTYALLDLVEQQSFHFPRLIVMETGGMKGKRREMIREEVHKLLKKGFGVAAIHSEYGMTELLSQAYSSGEGLFRCPPWMKILIRDTNDPFSLVLHGKSGGINVIDLANLNSCSFIQVQDLGKLHEDGSFEVLGRFDNSQVRGCNLMIN